MYILGLHTGHDASACLFKDNELIAFCKEERLNRIKNDGGFFDLQAVDEVLSIAGITRQDLVAVCMTRIQLPVECYHPQYADFTARVKNFFGKKKDLNISRHLFTDESVDVARYVDFSKLRNYLGLNEACEIVFTNHHYAHILSSLKFVDWKQDVLLLSCDGGGDNAQYSAYFYNDNRLRCLFGDDQTVIGKPQNSGASIGLAYAYATEICGFVPNRHEGKLTGLAAFGQPILKNEILEQFYLDDKGEVQSKLDGHSKLKLFLQNLFANSNREDIAAAIQVATEELIELWAKNLIVKTGARYIALSGGVFSNVRLNQVIAEIDGIAEVFVFPAMGDEGLSVGACVDFLVQKNGLQGLERTKLKHLYLGRAYVAEDLIEVAQKQGCTVILCNAEQEAARLLAEHQVGAIYAQAMEMGPRALGGRTILANPDKRDINDSINKRLQRTEFMPFAPFVCDDDAGNVFDIDDSNRYACRFMTITTNVKREWRDKIAAVVHVDGTARPQIIYREDNPLYYDVLKEFKAVTGLPVLVNTSFNAHEEPIINRPEEAVIALLDNRVDFLVCNGAIIRR